jgi:hypothetical protein
MPDSFRPALRQAVSIIATAAHTVSDKTSQARPRTTAPRSRYAVQTACLTGPLFEPVVLLEWHPLITMGHLYMTSFKESCQRLSGKEKVASVRR